VVEGKEEREDDKTGVVYADKVDLLARDRFSSPLGT
jgi:hypothetical protein